MAKISRRAAAVWKRLAQWYGARFLETYTTEPPEDWARLVDETSPERMEQALLAVRRESPVHPPTLGQLEAAIPPQRLDAGNAPSTNQQLATFALRRIAGELCRHQMVSSWNYFGDREMGFSGVQIPSCDECGKRSHRFLASELA